MKPTTPGVMFVKKAPKSVPKAPKPLILSAILTILNHYSTQQGK